MTILLTLYRLITVNPLARAVGTALAGLAALWAYGVAKKREGASTARADAAAKAAKDYRDTTERIQDAESAMDDDPAVLRDSLRHRDPKQR